MIIEELKPSERKFKLEVTEKELKFIHRGLYNLARITDLADVRKLHVQINVQLNRKDG
jgi:hypothetical protein